MLSNLYRKQVDRLYALLECAEREDDVDVAAAQRKFCSPVCRSSFHNRKHYEKMRQQARFCPNCGKPVSGRKTYCDAVCGNAFRQKQYFERKKAVAASQG